jgi:hypothetical protein
MFEILYLLIGTNNELYPDGFDVQKFIEFVESGSIWDKLIDKDVDLSNINFKVD